MLHKGCTRAVLLMSLAAAITVHIHAAACFIFTFLFRQALSQGSQNTLFLTLLTAIQRQLSDSKQMPFLPV